MITPPPLTRHLTTLFQRSTTLPHLLQLHSLLLKTALDGHRRLATQLVSSLCPLSVHHARSVFDRLPFDPSLYAWNCMIRGYTQNRCPVESIHLFLHLWRSGVEPDKFTYPFVFKACADSSNVGVGGMVHGLVLKAGFLSDLYVGNTLLHMYSCGGVIGCARKVFDEMGVRDVVSWSSMIEGYVSCDHPHEALLVFQRMRHANVKPNSVTLVSLLSACSHLASLMSGRSIHAYITVNKIKLGVALGTSLVDMYARCGHIDEGFLVFNSMAEKDLQSWTILISGFADHGRGKEAMSLFSQMEASGVTPDSMSFSGILCACSHLGLVDKGQNFFSKMVNVYKIQPMMEHYGCMVDLLGRAGLVEAAYEFIKKMHVAPNSVILRSFLGACREHGAISDADGKLMERLIKEEPDLGSNYVLAASVSALSGRWDDVALLRSNIARRGLKKVPGCSWVEVNSVSV